MRITILGNSGSGKSTMAHEIAAQHQIPMLELDTIVWEPGKIAVLRAAEDIRADVERFLSANDQWVVEGCYGELIQLVLPHCTEAIFLNPGVDACLANNRRRQWEPHKYDSPEAQEAMLELLLEWAADYYTRDDRWSYAFHRRVFDSFDGKKTEITHVSTHIRPNGSEANMKSDLKIVVASDSNILIKSFGDISNALSACLGKQGLILTEKDLAPEFFDLRTGLAGELFQKFINYKVRVAIVLPNPEAHGTRFSELAYEHASHTMIRFVRTEDEARIWLRA